MDHIYHKTNGKMLFSIATIFAGLLFTWNWGGATPQFLIKDYSVSLNKSVAQIHLVQKQNDLLVIEGVFYNSNDQEINVQYKLTVIKSGSSKSSSTQSGNLSIDGKSNKVLSRSTLNLNNKDYYKISLKVYQDNQLIAEDSKTFYGDNIIWN